MSDTENAASPADLMKQFDAALEARLAATKPDTAAVDPRLKAIFTTAVAQSLDVVGLSSEEICAQFVILAVAGVDLVRPTFVKINTKFEPLLPMNPYDKMIPIIRPATGADDAPLGIYIP